MINYTKRYVNIISLIVTTIIFISINNTILKDLNFDFNPLFIKSYFRRNIILVEMKIDDIKENTKDRKEKYEYVNIMKKQSNQPDLNTKEEWRLIIPIISLDAQISESTTEETINKYIGHFEETPKLNGNIGLAAHNRGYQNNYFADLKKLKIGDEIIYKYNKQEKRYKVNKNIIIKDTDWSYLKNTKENKITLITCVENKPEYRRCIQGAEIN